METIFLDFLARRSSFFVSWKRIFRRMLHSRWWKRIFWLVETIIYIFSETPPGESFFSVWWKRIFERILHCDYWRRIFSLMETAALLESFFLEAETVTAMSWNQFLKTELILLVETDFLASRNYFPLTLSDIFFKDSFIPVSGNAFFCPKE